MSLSPDGSHVVAVSQTHHHPPFTRLLDGEGNVLAELASTDLTRYRELGLKKVEMFTFTGVENS